MAKEARSAIQSDEQDAAGETRPSRRRGIFGKLLRTDDTGADRTPSRSRNLYTVREKLARRRNKTGDGADQAPASSTVSIQSAESVEKDQPNADAAEGTTEKTVGAKSKKKTNTEESEDDSDDESFDDSDSDTDLERFSDSEDDTDDDESVEDTEDDTIDKDTTDAEDGIIDHNPKHAEADDEPDMWAEAEKKLQENTLKRKRLIKYNAFLEEQLGEPLKPTGTRARREQFHRFLNKAVEDEEKGDGTKLEIYAKGTEKIAKGIARFVVAFGELVAPATSSCLPAGVAATGIVVLTKLCLRASEQNQKLMDNLQHVSGFVYRVAEYEILCRQIKEPINKTEHPGDAYDETKTAFTEACCKIIEFQTQALYVLQKNAAKKFIRNMVEYDHWDELFQGIKEAEDRVFRCAQVNGMGNIQALFPEFEKLKEDSNAQRHEDKANRFLAFLSENTCKYRETKKRNMKRVRGTCKWFTRHSLFKAWRARSGAGASNVLYVTADPGRGKSVLSAYLVDEVLPRRDEAVCYFFFKDDFQDQKTAKSALCALLHQLFDTRRSLLTEDILNTFEGRGEKPLSVLELWSILVQAASTQKIVCVLDALDECYESEMTPLVEEIVKNKAPNLKFLLTSRPYGYISRTIDMELRQSRQFKVARMHLQGDSDESVSQITLEIKRVIKARVRDIARTWRLSKSERQLMLDQMSSVENRTYLWVALVFDGLIGDNKKADITKEDILALTKKPPKGIYAAYEQILRKSQDQKKTRRLLQLILGAQRPLTLAEVSAALQLGDYTEIKTKESIRNLCGLFVTIVDNRVYLLHQTAREFLIYNSPEPAMGESQHATIPWPGETGSTTASRAAVHAWAVLLALFLRVMHWLHRLWLFVTNSWQYSMDPTTANETLAAVCMACLHTEDTNSSLFEYAAEYWPAHYRLSGSRFRAKTGKAAHDLCDSPSNLKWTEDDNDRNNLATSGLHLASFLGLDGAVREFLKEIRSSTQTPTVRNINAKIAPYNQTALCLAASEGHITVVRLLLGKNAEIDSKDRGGQTPLSCAAMYGCEEVMQLLLEKKAEIDSKDTDGRTPLSHAARGGHEKVVQLLLEKGKAEIDSRDNDGRTPLSHATRSTNEKVVQLLLEKKAEIDSKDNYSRTPLLHAAEDGNENVVQLLLEKKAEIDSKDTDGRTPLSHAATSGNEKVVQLLLEKGKAEIASRDKDGRTPLSHAARRGHKKVVQLLLEKKAEIDSKDNFSRTPLLHAAENGNEDVVQLLLENNAEVDSKDRFGLTPLSAAALYGRKKVVQLLLERKAETDSRDNDGQTPLLYAASNGYEKVVQLLLENKAEINSRDNDGLTPLSYAARGGHKKVVQTLLDTGQINTTDMSYTRAMENAMDRGHSDIYDLLSVYKADASARENCIPSTATVVP